MLTRRTFLLAAGSTAAVLGQGGTLTARAVIERIQKNVGVPWAKETVDTFKTGDPETPVRGIATSFGGTFDVLRKAAAANRNLIIVHEPTFYNHQDDTSQLAGQVYETKQELIRKNALVVWRFHDHWHRRNPDGILKGAAEAMGWEKFRSAPNSRSFAVPATTLAVLAAELKSRLSVRTMRVIGEPALNVKNVAVHPGFNSPAAMMRALENDAVDVLVIGEAREWEGIEFARDAVSQGRKKGLIVLGHVPSEEPGMKECAAWLKTFITEVPIEFIPSEEPFWSPK